MDKGYEQNYITVKNINIQDNAETNDINNIKKNNNNNNKYYL
jgi:hypothetical protein